MRTHEPSCDVLVIGCGPYGLAATAHLRAAGMETRIFGEPMKFWKENAPPGMMLRSSRLASDIGACHPRLTLSSFLKNRETTPSGPLPVRSFIEYGQWFQQQIAPDADRRHISDLTATSDHFVATTEDGEAVTARRVVVATGIADFAHRPEPFRCISPSMVSHSSDAISPAEFVDSRVAVIGSGQSAIESAALLSEAGAEVEVIMRSPRIHWLKGRARLRKSLGPLGKALFPWTEVGFPPLNQIVAHPGLFWRLPASMRIAIDRRTMQASVANWLERRIAGVVLTSSRVVRAAHSSGPQIELLLNDGSSRVVDRVVLATGFQIDIARLTFLAPALRAAIACLNGYPRLTSGFESTMPGLHFIGAAAALSFGSLTRFVAGTTYSANALIRAIRHPARSHAPHVTPQRTAFT